MVSNFRVKQWSDVRPFLDEAGAFLSAREDVNAVILGISQNISRSDRPDNSDNFFALVYEGQKPVAAAFRTPPHGVALTQGPNEAMTLLADAVKERYDAIPGANGPQAAVNAFSKRIASVTGQQIKVRFEMRIHRLETVEPLSVPNGQLRRAEPKDRDLLHRWMTEFSNITLERDGPTMDQVEALLAIPDPRFYFWCVGETPVSTAAWARPTSHGITVNGVFTPDNLRGNGYGTAVVHGLSSLLLERGYSFCTLYTDLANPVSNAIYARIGYRPVLDTRNLIFE